MSDMNVAFPSQDQQNVLAEHANVVFATTAFTSGTTKNTATGFDACRKGTILVTTVSATVTVYLITAVTSDGTLTGKQISNA